MREVVSTGFQPRLWAAALLGAALCAGQPAWGQSVFINEVHYDNHGADADERVEVAGPAGADMKGWSLVFYNGRNGKPYRTVALKGAIPDQQQGYGTLSFPVSRIENGAPDGIALVNAAGEVTQFMSYEGGFSAASGPAKGLAATDIGVRETGSTRAGDSLQLKGSGNSLADFTWHGPSRGTPGLVNGEQTFVPSRRENAGGEQAASAPMEVVRESR